MSETWLPLPFDRPLFANLDPDAVIERLTALENGFLNELGGHTRFPGMEVFTTLNDNGRVYLSDFQGDLIAGTSNGRIYRIAQNGTINDVTGVPVSGGGRMIFAKSPQEMYAAAGGPIVRLRGGKTELLSSSAPLATHVVWIDGYIVANLINSQQWFYSNPGQPDQWPALNTEFADSSAANITAMLMTPFRELMLCGTEAVEQWERITSGNVPFWRRWAMADAVKCPYVLTFADNGIWTVNRQDELVKMQGQASAVASGDIGLLLEQIDDWTDAWMGGYPAQPLNIVGQKLLVLQVPHATNSYGTKGLTIVFDYRQRRFFLLYGWDPTLNLPTRWPGWSHWRLWDEVFIGGEGVIYRLTPGAYNVAGMPMRWLTRTAHIAKGNATQIKNLRVQLKRGTGTPGTAATIRIRCRRDAKPFGNWVARSLGVGGANEQFLEFGSFGTATTHMFEIECIDDAEISLIKVEAKTMDIGH
jgi:hypothetical protein